MPDPLDQALAEALDDEFKAIATYEAVIAALGPLRPFVHIVEAERRHARRHEPHAGGPCGCGI